MRVLGLSGSLRRDSHNMRLLNGTRKLLPEGIELDVFEGLAAIPPTTRTWSSTANPWRSLP